MPWLLLLLEFISQGPGQRWCYVAPWSSPIPVCGFSRFPFRGCCRSCLSFASVDTKYFADDIVNRTSQQGSDPALSATLHEFGCKQSMLLSSQIVYVIALRNNSQMVIWLTDLRS